MLARIADDLGGLVETHRLRIEQSRAENLGMMTFHPGRGVGDLGEAGGMTFRKTVAADALDLLECASGEVSSVAAFDHSSDHFVFKMGEATGGLARGHGTPELVDLGRGGSGDDDRPTLR